MLVKELIEHLSRLNPNLPVWVSGDEEGNSFNELYVVETSHVIDSGCDSHPVHPDDIDDYEEDELSEGVILWP